MRRPTTQSIRPGRLHSGAKHYNLVRIVLISKHTMCFIIT
jgi:hypothetical protein